MRAGKTCKRLNGNNSQAFSYDNLNRLASFTNGSGTMQQTYTIDAWGNMSMSGTASSGLVFAANNNRDTSGTLTYDASGNVTSIYNGISRPTLTYDAEGKVLTAGSSSADEHRGKGWSNVMYIGSTVGCEKNWAYVEQQKTKFLEGRTPPNFAPDDFEVDFVGRATVDDLTTLGKTQLGLLPH